MAGLINLELFADFFNKIGTKPTCCDVCYSVSP
jgi:hypothetical protein